MQSKLKIILLLCIAFIIVPKITLAHSEALAQVGPPPLPWADSEPTNTTYPFVYFSFVNKDGGTLYQTDNHSRVYIQGQSNTHFYVGVASGAKALYADTTVYGAEHTDIGWTIHTCGGSTACIWTAGTPIFYSTELSDSEFDQIFENSYHNAPIFTDDSFGDNEYNTELGAQIKFNPDYLYDGRELPDFRKWPVCITILAQTPTTNFYWTVTYDGDDIDETVNSSRDFIGPVQTPHLTEGLEFCGFLPKTVDLTPGESYNAQAKIYDQNDNLISQSDTLNLNINFAEHTDFPTLASIGSDDEVNTCSRFEPVAFSFTIPVVDERVDVPSPVYWGCKALVYMFVPPAATIAKWGDLKDNLAERAPLLWFEQVKTTFTDIDTSGSGDFTALTLNTGSGTPIDINMDFFSSDTIGRYTGSSRDTLRTVAQWALYLAFLTMVILEVRHIFKSKQT